ncbi:MAG: hypothetical protein HRT66_12620 [Flavobacteriaceae bacterium]|nr:hypothetical protein [Flavobacteriaceae bacterium]
MEVVNKYDKDKLDCEFISLLDEKLIVLEEKYNQNELRIISYETLKIMAKFIELRKPISKMREHKLFILIYVDTLLSEDRDFINNKINLNYLKNKLLSNTCMYLERCGFYNKSSWYIYVILMLVVDLIVIIYNKGWYYVPIMSMITILFHIIKERKLKKQGKLLDLS